MYAVCMHSVYVCVCGMYAVLVQRVCMQNLQLCPNGGAAVLVLHPHGHHDHREVEEQQRPAKQRLVELEGAAR